MATKLQSLVTELLSVHADVRKGQARIEEMVKEYVRMVGDDPVYVPLEDGRVVELNGKSFSVLETTVCGGRKIDHENTHLEQGRGEVCDDCGEVMEQ